MKNQLVNIESVTDKIRDRIQAEFVNLIPKEAWDNLVKSQVEWFVSDSGYRHNEPAPLKALIRRELEKMFVEQIKKELSEMQGLWSGDGKVQAGEAVKNLVKEIAPELWEIAIADVVQRAVDGFRNQMSQLQY